MVPVAAPRLTRIGFRRDVKLFLGVLVTFLVLLIMVLLLLLQGSIRTDAEEMNARWNDIADMATEWLTATARPQQAGDIEGRLIYLRGRLDVTAIELSRGGSAPIVSGNPSEIPEIRKIARTTSFGTVTYDFDASGLEASRRRFMVTAAIAFGTSLLGGILLFLYIPRIVRPIEEMLDQAKELGENRPDGDETRYLIETFRTSIERLKLQEAELKRLHDLEKARADELERITATLTRSLSSGFVAFDREGAIVDANVAAREILSLDPASTVSGRKASAAFGDSPFSRVLEDAVRERQTLAREEVPLYGERILGLSTVQLVNEQNQFFGMLALFTDLTPIRKLESRLREMQTLADLGEISAGIAHEFRNALSTILGYLKLAQRDELPPEAGRRVARAEAEAVELSTAVERLLNFARPINLESRPVNVNDLIESIFDRFGAQAPEIDFSMTGDPLRIEGDPNLLARAFENIVRNGVDAIREKGTEGRVRVEIRKSPVPRVTFTDNGIGIDEKDVQRLFLPFQSGKPAGTGLGLAITRKILLLHGATIRLAGTAESGAQVTIEFPPQSEG
ncbi:MAG: ATP-binding protein [Thermoanaerobaculia bacterium]